MKVEIINNSKHATPHYATDLSAGMDLRANISETIVLKPLERRLIPTGLSIALPDGYEAQIRPRSGLAYKKGITHHLLSFLNIIPLIILKVVMYIC